ncbi:hypothetical protein H7K05_10405 [Priestia aryabhattai]|uniref:helix-turn-helix domain-containing protein n=1 Tax=Priestia aryabhattai TaxID=412384 RepID=UPI001C8E2646|nr:helix-turn-helix domain-containing protein [Priestia aryabhattai]MBY0005736.1 hypothetical protein [Priestia aryabhattai]MBY0047583.1 hypothetical protein [Priestia aryabhattai]
MGKATNGYKREHGLTIDQLNAIDLLIIGKTDKEVADVVGINRVTVTKWRNYDLHFQAELNKCRRVIWNASIDRMRALVPQAIERLEQEVKSESGWKVALEVIKIAGIEGCHIKDIGYDNSEKILNELAEKRATEELFSTTSDYTKQKVLGELQEQLNNS